MLVEFTVENYKSFRDRTTLSMVAAKITSFEKSLDEENVIDAKPDLKLLRSAGIYGANASGKSNLASALGFMHSFILGSARDLQANDPIAAEPFLLSTETEKEPSLFEIVIVVEGIEYRYGFQANAERIVSEWLYASFTTKETTLFTRDEQNIKVGAKFREGKGLQEKTRSNALFLSVVAQFNGPVSLKVLHWFQALVLTSKFHPQHFQEFIEISLLDDRSKQFVKNFIQLFDLCIEDINLEKVSSSSSASKYRVKTMHAVRDNIEGNVGLREFDLESQESEGTRKLFAMSTPLIMALQFGDVVMIDEIDSHLHPLITRAIIKLFNSRTTNPGNAQLLFITHDTNLLDKSLLRRDQVWFAEKDRQGATHLASLVEYKVRNDESFEKNYIQGRYGAIPFLGDLTRLPVASDV